MPSDTIGSPEKGKRCAYFDNLRAILIILVLVGHFGGDNTSFGPDGNLYLQALECFIYLFHMPLFLFLSGLFSKKTEACRERAFFNLFIPYLIFQLLYGLVLYALNRDLTFLRNPFWPAPALWYLFALFLYRLLLHDVVKLRWNLALAGLLALFSFLLTGLSHDFAMNRAAAYFVFFLLGYHVRPEKLLAVRNRLRARKGIFALTVLGLLGFGCAACIALFRVLDRELLSFHDLIGLIAHSTTYSEVGNGWRSTFLLTVLVLCATVLLSVLLMLLTPEKESRLTGIGRDTLPLYLSHSLVQLLYYRVQRKHFFFPSWTANFLLSLVPAALCVLVFSSGWYRKGFHLCLERIESILKRRCHNDT